MFSKFSLDEVDPISKLGAKVEPSYTPECARKWDAAAEVSALRLFELRSHDIPEQKTVVAPWPIITYRFAMDGASQTVAELPLMKIYEETEVPRSPYWQEQLEVGEAKSWLGVDLAAAPKVSPSVHEQCLSAYQEAYAGIDERIVSALFRLATDPMPQVPTFDKRAK
jgi:hypothetical protein